MQRNCQSCHSKIVDAKMKEQNRQWDAKAKDLVDYKQISLDANQRTNIGY